MYVQSVELVDEAIVETDPTGRYGRFNDVLGKGAMKTVYKAIDEVLMMEVAWNQVKLNELLQSPGELQRLYSEVHLLSTLNNESIIRFYTSWIDVDKRTFNFITEMFTSGTLRQYRKKHKHVDIRAIKIWARQILRGLVYLHGHDPPVIHRDLKCDNIFVNGHLGQVKIGDFGLAAVLHGSRSAHSVIGTPEFMAPELYDEDYNELVDVYSFGMCCLEMLTSEYPYSECSNPAQIYRKVTSGKLPQAFYRIQDLEAQKFIGKCLATVSKRLSAKELLLDPFLASDKDEVAPKTKIGTRKSLLDDMGLRKLRISNNPLRTKMTITGKLNPDDSIFLKVQITNKDGSLRNIFFPFDILSDTPIDVATEMVKELDIADWEPIEIAYMINGEISSLLPNWKKLDQPKLENLHAFDYPEEEYDGEGTDHDHPFSSSSSQTSPFGSTTSRGIDDVSRGNDWLQDDLFDDASSQSSSQSAQYSNMNNHSGYEHTNDCDTNSMRRDAKTHKSTRFGPEESHSMIQSIASTCYKQCKLLVDSQAKASKSKDNRAMDMRTLTRNRSLVDVHSQLLHRSLVEEVNKRRMFKTVGAVENIGFQSPCEVSGKASSVRTTKDGKKQPRNSSSNTQY